MNDKQNIADLIGALAEDIEEIKKKLDAKDSTDKDEALKRLAERLEPVIRFFGGSTAENLSGIFGSEETIAAYKKSLGEQMIVSMEEYTDATNEDMRKRGIPTIKDLIYRILEMQTSLVENTKRTSGKVRQKHGLIQSLRRTIRPDKTLNAIRRLWDKVPDGWHKNPYVWTSIGFTVVFSALFAVSWVQWHRYREENIRLRTVADKYQVTSVMLNELYPELSVTVGAYEKLVDAVGADSTLAVFNRQLKIVREENHPGQQN